MTKDTTMRLSFLMCFVLGMSGAAIAQVPASSDSSEGRYVTACLKESTQAYCRCEFQAVKQHVSDPTDVAFIVNLEEQTAGIPDSETDKIIKKLPQARQQWLVTVEQQIAPVLKTCPGYKEHK